jgi:FkbM family methyltransferase
LKAWSVRNQLRKLRENFHPLYHLRKSGLGRRSIGLLDFPVWLSLPGVNFKVRGQLLTHGLGFAATGSSEQGSESLALICVDVLNLESFWDVGANIGYYTWLLKSAAPQLRCLLFEASPQNAEFVQSTLDKNRLPNVELVAAGASDRLGEACLRVDSLAGATSTLDESATQTFEEQHFGVSSAKIAIALVTIDSERHRRQRVDFLKIDVEGHEAAVLRGAEQTILSDQPILFVECFHSGHPCLQNLELQGYRFVDSDRLRIEFDSSTANYFGFPRKFHSKIDPLLNQARERLKASGISN